MCGLVWGGPRESTPRSGGSQPVGSVGVDQTYWYPRIPNIWMWLRVMLPPGLHPSAKRRLQPRRETTGKIPSLSFANMTAMPRMLMKLRPLYGVPTPIIVLDIMQEDEAQPLCFTKSQYFDLIFQAFIDNLETF